MITDKSRYGHDAVLDLNCSDSVQVLRTEPMTLTEQEQAIVRKYLGIALLEKSYIDANGHLMVVLSDGRTLDVGSARGLPGPVPYVGANGNWFVEGVDTLISAQGVQGFTPYIGPNGNWFINGADTGKQAVGVDGETPYIGPNGNWFINGADTGKQAVGVDGETPYIGPNGNWWIGAQDTGVRATVEVVQTTGDDPKKVMSQKAVTEKFNSYGIYVENGYLCMEV
jgi:hypothetical protein